MTEHTYDRKLTQRERAAIERVKTRLRNAADPVARIAASNSEDVALSVIALHEYEQEWRAGERAEQGRRERVMYRGYVTKLHGVVFRKIDGRTERERCCANGHTTQRAAREHAARVARKLNKDARTPLPPFDDDTR